jgi:hypothetical protein
VVSSVTPSGRICSRIGTIAATRSISRSRWSIRLAVSRPLLPGDFAERAIHLGDLAGDFVVGGLADPGALGRNLVELHRHVAGGGGRGGLARGQLRGFGQLPQCPLEASDPGGEAVRAPHRAEAALQPFQRIELRLAEGEFAVGAAPRRGQLWAGGASHARDRHPGAVAPGHLGGQGHHLAAIAVGQGVGEIARSDLGKLRGGGQPAEGVLEGA